MDDFTELIARKFAKEVQKLNFVQSLPCRVVAVNDDESCEVELIANGARYTVLNYSGTSVNVGETVQLYYRGNLISNTAAFIGAAETKDGGSFEEIYNAGKTVLAGTKVTIGGTEYTVANNAEIFNDYANNHAVYPYSHAEGYLTNAIGYAAHAEGNSTNANGAMAHTEGYQTNVAINATFAHAEGQGTNANASASHAEGQGTTVSGFAGHAEGSGTNATGSSSHSEGSSTTASGSYSHAEGNSTTASGDYSHTEGYYTATKKIASHAEGWYTIAGGRYQHVEGKYNIEDTNDKYAFIIGNGTSGNKRSNAFAIDWNGLIYINNAETGIDLNNLSVKLANVTGANYIGEIFLNARIVSEIDLTATNGTDCTLHFDGTILGTSSGIAEFSVTVDDVQQNFSCKESVFSGSYHNVSFAVPITLVTGKHYIKVWASGIGNIYPICAFVSGIGITESDVSPEIDSSYIYDASGDSTRLLYYKGTSGTPQVPVKLGSKEVTVLSATAFNYSDVSNGYIPEGVEEIE